MNYISKLFLLFSGGFPEVDELAFDVEVLSLVCFIFAAIFAASDFGPTVFDLERFSVMLTALFDEIVFDLTIKVR